MWRWDTGSVWDDSTGLRLLWNFSNSSNSFLEIYPFLEGEYYDFILTINGEISSATLQRPYSVNISFPDSLIIGEQYLIEWNISSNNLNQGFITETEITNEYYDELIYYELDPSIRDFLYTNDWLDSLDIEEGFISLALSQWDCAQDNDVYFVSEYYLEEDYLLSGMKSTHDPNITINKIIERITKILKWFISFLAITSVSVKNTAHTE